MEFHQRQNFTKLMIDDVAEGTGEVVRFWRSWGQDQGHSKVTYMSEFLQTVAAYTLVLGHPGVIWLHHNLLCSVSCTCQLWTTCFVMLATTLVHVHEDNNNSILDYEPRQVGEASVTVRKLLAVTATLKSAWRHWHCMCMFVMSMIVNTMTRSVHNTKDQILLGVALTSFVLYTVLIVFVFLYCSGAKKWKWHLCEDIVFFVFAELAFSMRNLLMFRKRNLFEILPLNCEFYWFCTK